MERRAPMRERRSESLGLPAVAGGPASKFDNDHLTNPGAINGAVSRDGCT